MIGSNAEEKITRELKHGSLKDYINMLNYLSAMVEEVCANGYLNEYQSLTGSRLMETTSRPDYCLSAINAYTKCLDDVSFNSDVERLYNNGTLSTYLSTLDVDKEKAKHSLASLKRLAKNVKDDTEEQYLIGIYNGFVNAINNLQIKIQDAIKDTGHEMYLKGHDFKELGSF